MKNKKINIVLVILALVVIGITVIFMLHNKTKTSGTIHIYIAGENNQVLLDKDVPFYEEDMLIDVLQRYVKIEEGTNSSKGMIMGINNTKTDISKNYFKVIINCEFAMHGAWDQTLNDKDDIRIIYSDINDWSTGC